MPLVLNVAEVFQEIKQRACEKSNFKHEYIKQSTGQLWTAEMSSHRLWSPLCAAGGKSAPGLVLVCRPWRWRRPTLSSPLLLPSFGSQLDERDAKTRLVALCRRLWGVGGGQLTLMKFTFELRVSVEHSAAPLPCGDVRFVAPMSLKSTVRLRGHN